MQLNEYKYDNLNRKDAFGKWKTPIVELLEKKSNIKLDETNPRHARKLKWMSTLNEAVSSRNPNRSFLIMEDGGYNSLNPDNMYGMGAISLSNPTASGNTRTTGAADKGSGDYLKQMSVTSMHIAAATIAFELLPVIPLEVAMVQMTFVESIYGNPRVNDADLSPDYIEIPWPFLVAQDGNTTGFEGAVVANGALPKLVKGNIYYLAADGALADQLATGLALELRYIGKHHISANFRFQVVKVVEITNAATGAFSASTSVVADFLTAFATAADGFALSFPLVVDTTMNFTDAATVKVGAVSNATAPAIDVVDTKETPIFGAANRDGYTETPMPREESEKGTERIVTLRTWSTSAKVSDFDITCSVTAKQQRDLKQGKINAYEVVLEAAKTQLVQSTNNHILDTMFKLGVENHLNIFKGTGLNLHLYVDDPSVASQTIAAMNISDTESFNLKKLDGTDVAAEFGAIPNFRTSNQDDGQLDIVRMVKSRTNLVSAVIGKLTRTTKADFVVCGTGIAAALVDSRNHAVAPLDQNILAGSEALSYFGTCEGMDMYVDPRMDVTDNRILVGRRGNELDSGLKYFVYDLLSEIDTIEGLNMSKKGLVSTSYALVAAGFHPEANYVTFIAETRSGLWA